MSLKFEDFSPEQRNVIGEFVYSYETEILIKADALSLIKLFQGKELVTEQHAGELSEKIINNKEVIDELLEILFTSIEDEEGRKIMEEYFGKRSNAVD